MPLFPLIPYAVAAAGATVAKTIWDQYKTKPIPDVGTDVNVDDWDAFAKSKEFKPFILIATKAASIDGETHENEENIDVHVKTKGIHSIKEVRKRLEDQEHVDEKLKSYLEGFIDFKAIREHYESLVHGESDSEIKKINKKIEDLVMEVAKADSRHAFSEKLFATQLRIMFEGKTGEITITLNEKHSELNKEMLNQLDFIKLIKQEEVDKMKEEKPISDDDIFLTMERFGDQLVRAEEAANSLMPRFESDVIELMRICGASKIQITRKSMKANMKDDEDHVSSGFNVDKASSRYTRESGSNHTAVTQDQYDVEVSWEGEKASYDDMIEYINQKPYLKDDDEMLKFAKSCFGQNRPQSKKFSRHTKNLKEYSDTAKRIFSGGLTVKGFSFDGDYNSNKSSESEHSQEQYLEFEVKF